MRVGRGTPETGGLARTTRSPTTSAIAGRVGCDFSSSAPRLFPACLSCWPPPLGLTSRLQAQPLACRGSPTVAHANALRTIGSIGYRLYAASLTSAIPPRRAVTPISNKPACISARAGVVAVRPKTA